MDIKTLQQLILNRLRTNLTDVRSSKIRTDTKRWIISRFPDNKTSPTLEDFKNKYGYPLVIVQTPSLSKAVLYNNGGLESEYVIELNIQHIGSLVEHDTLINNIFLDISDAVKTNFFLQSNLYFVSMDFKPDSATLLSQEKNYNSVITITFSEDGN